MQAFELAEMPADFVELQRSPPRGFTLSDRVLRPGLLIERGGQQYRIRLVGIRRTGDGELIHDAPGIRHAWVLDGTVIRPLPRDIFGVILKMLRGADPDRLTYRDAVDLIRGQEAFGIDVFPSDSFATPGRVAAEEYASRIEIGGLNAELFPYQARGVQWMWTTIANAGGLILADEMGLGKTIQIIALLLLHPPESASPALIICPSSLVANWLREFSRFAPGLSVGVHRGPNRTGVYRGLQKVQVVITTYDTMAGDIGIFSAMEWSWVIADEAQAIKNPESGRRQAISRIPRLRTIAMTGTPVENKLLDLWSLIDFVVPNLLGDRSRFEEHFPDSLESAKALAKVTDPIVLRRRVADVAQELPSRIEIDLPLELDDQLAHAYREVRTETLARYRAAGALVATLQLQLFCAHPWLRAVVRGEENYDEFLDRSKPDGLMTPKMERTRELLNEAFFNRRKVLVFSLFNEMDAVLKEVLQGSRGVFWDAVNGSTPQEERQPIIDKFSEFDGPAVLVLNPRAAGAGLNITAATIVIHLTPVWNPALESQASARAHRRGQTQPVTIYRLYYKDTVEQVMVERSLWKSALANESVPVSSRDPVDLKRALEIEPRRE